jgi:hypothetical protein
MADKERVELLHGTLDLIVLRALATMGPLHAPLPTSIVVPLTLDWRVLLFALTLSILGRP